MIFYLYNHSKSRFSSIIILTFLLYLSFDTVQGQNALQQTIYNIALDEDFRHGSLSICIIDLQNDSMVASYQPNTSLVPASTVKIFTTYAALAILGQDFRFKTELQYGGEFVDSTLNGSVFIKGWGDPTLGSARFPRVDNIKALNRKFINALQKECIYKINGYIVSDGSYYEPSPVPNTWQYDDIGNYYGAGSFGLNFHDNEYTLYFKQNPEMWSRPVIERTYPAMPEQKFINNVSSASPRSGDNTYIFGDPYSNVRFVTGTIPSGKGYFTVRGSIPNPPLTCANRLVKDFSAIDSNNVNMGAIDINEYIKTVGAPLFRHTFYTHYSPRLSDIILQTNHRSVNLYAETLLRELGKTLYAQGTVDAGIKVLYQFWKDAGLNTHGLFFEDGSGLSARNGVSAWHFTQALSIARKDSLNFQTYYNSLPVAGKEGTVRRLLNGYKGKAEVRVKSGTMRRVKSYCGYAKAEDGKEYAFAFIANNYSCSSGKVRDQVENILRALIITPKKE